MSLQLRRWRHVYVHARRDWVHSEKIFRSQETAPRQTALTQAMRALGNVKPTAYSR